MIGLRGREVTRARIENGLWQFCVGPFGPGHFQPV